MPMLPYMIKLDHHLSVHRDLKPHNILLCKHPKKRICAKISDFGLSKKYKPDETTSSSGSRGTRGWTARELHDKTLKEKVYMYVASKQNELVHTQLMSIDENDSCMWLFHPQGSASFYY